MEQKKAVRLFWLCWLAYYFATLGRLGWGTALGSVLAGGGLSAAQAGLVGTGFFLCYGGGQLASGWLGDRLSPKGMVAAGLFGTAAFNLLMAFSASAGFTLAVWCANGLCQSFLWCPILRILAEDLPRAFRKRAIVHMAATYPAAMLTMYLGGAGLLQLGGWRPVFATVAGLVLVMAALWVWGTRALGLLGGPAPRPAKAPQAGGAPKSHLPWIALVCLALALVAQGALRDGLVNWVPAYLQNGFGASASLAVFATTALPLINMSGVYAARWLFGRVKNEALASLALFGVALLAALWLYAGPSGFGLALAAFCCITSCMVGVNLMLVSFVPTAFAGLGRVSAMAGILNASVYVGSAFSMYGIGAVADSLGWGALNLFLLLFALAGGLLCLLAAGPWGRFKGQM